MRLIDADSINFEEVFGGKSDFAKDLRETAQKLIDRQPTAFDKEKVIEELKKQSNNYYPSIDHYCLSRKAVNLKDALKIVEKGGI